MFTLLRFYLTLLVLLDLFASCTLPVRLPAATTTSQPNLAPVIEQPVTLIPLGEPLAGQPPEISSMAWYRDALVLAPQFPQRFDNQFFYLPKTEILDFLQGATSGPLTPQPLPLAELELTVQIAGYEGFEAIAFAGETVFLTVEAEESEGMVGHLLTGFIAPDLSVLRLDPEQRVEIPPQAQLENMTDEAIVLADNQVLTFYEANGFVVNPRPVAHRFSINGLQPLDPIPIPNLEYRLTDATPLDEKNRFWVVNYFFPGDEGLTLGPDPLATRYGVGPTHAQQQTVERLVEMQYSGDRIIVVDAPPIQLQLLDDVARNWEGIVRLETPEINGFLLVTDRFPETLLGFVPRPEAPSN